jgi:hypothetical protein
MPPLRGFLKPPAMPVVFDYLTPERSIEMMDTKEDCIDEVHFQYGAVKNLQVSGTKTKITIEIDLDKTIKSLRYDLNPYSITQGQLNYEYLAEVIARQLDWNAYALSTNDDHELAHLLASLKDN